ncbi:hypothetical protein O7627_19545 [Solwaraspora sp. WMMD1047]|uniref:hypothetical protein n=1 Tax=Solwaraspora sp. WMMD1047 TaxID=3016102 RepID=UPI002416A7B3|nr:hypothetical protein [Solwaraspora sp. WMMD1047]MDG4831496.1 hypothetical protein [Solwaraspora sp. WMMD1047]
MRGIGMRRRVIAGTVAVALGVAGGLVGPPATAAYALGDPRRSEETSDHNGAVSKGVTVQCPGRGRVLGAGGLIIDDGTGRVVLTGVIPDDTLRSVTVTATARAGYQQPWSVRAYAVCDEVDRPVKREESVAVHSREATVECPADSLLLGAGFRLTGWAESSYLGGVEFGPDLRRLQVRATGVGMPTSVTAFGVCLYFLPHGDDPVSTRSETVTLDGTWPKVVAVTGTDPDRRLYGVAAAVDGPPTVFINALVPDPDTDTASARAVLATQPPGPDPAAAPATVDPAAVGRGAAADAGPTLTVEATEGGTFH